MKLRKNKDEWIETGDIPWDKFQWYNEKLYFPLKNCIKYSGGISLVVGIRNDGKTFCMLQFMLEDYEKNGNISMMVYNNATLVEEGMDRVLVEGKKHYPEMWSNYITTKDGVVDIRTKKVMIIFKSIGQAKKYKGSRDSRIKRICIDEFNRFDEKVKNKYPATIDEILVTFGMVRDDFELILFGNGLSVNHRLLLSWKITTLPKGISYKPFSEKLSGSKFEILVYNYKRDKNQLEKRYDKNWVYEMTKYTGSWDHNFANQMLDDNSDYIMEINLENLKYISSFNTDDMTFNIYTIKGSDIWYVKYVEGDDSDDMVNKEDEYILAGGRKDINNRVLFSPEWKKTMTAIVSNNKMLYNNQVSKDAVMKVIR